MVLWWCLVGLVELIIFVYKFGGWVGGLVGGGENGGKGRIRWCHGIRSREFYHVYIVIHR
jgi:hypothetical protein